MTDRGLKSLAGLAAIALLALLHLLSIELRTGTSQILVVLDASASMSRSAGVAGYADDRWQLGQDAIVALLDHLPAGYQVGGVRAGGQCDADLPSLAPADDNRAVRAFLAAGRPGGAKPLIQGLQTAARRFSPTARGRRILLVTDGQDSCRVGTDLCEVARQLHRHHDIRIDVVSFPLDNAMTAHLRCAAEVSGGRLITPGTLDNWYGLGDTLFAPYRWLLLAFGGLCLLSAAPMIYRYSLFVLGMPPSVTAPATAVGLGVALAFLGWVVLV